MKYKIIIISIIMLINIKIVAQETVKININQAEKKFLEKNLILLAEHCNIDIAKANLLQAKVFNNPSFSASLNIYNPESQRVFDVCKNSGQYTFAIEQIIRIGGQRNKEIALLKLDVNMSELQFYELLRTLNFTLHSVFYELYFTSKSLQAFDTQILLLKDLQNKYKELKNRGIVALDEVVRIQSLLYSLQADKLDLESNFNELQSRMQLFLQDNNSVFVPVVEKSELAKKDFLSKKLNNLIDKALENRNDLKISKTELLYSQKKIALERANAIPNLTVGADFDKRSGAFDNQFSLSMGIDLPIFNRNKGNIRVAKEMEKQQQFLLEQKKLEIENEVIKAYNNLLKAEETEKSIATDFMENLELLLQSITDNFTKKNISMLEFVDFYESYRDNIIKINQIRNKKIQAEEELMFAIGGLGN